MTLSRLTKGYFVMDREIFSERIIGDPTRITLWVTINYFANMKDGIARCSTRDLEVETKLDNVTIKRTLDLFESWGLVKIKKSKSRHVKTEIRICNYGKKYDKKSETVNETVNETVDETVNETVNNPATGRNKKEKSPKKKMRETVNETVNETMKHASCETVNECSMLDKETGLETGLELSFQNAPLFGSKVAIVPYDEKTEETKRQRVKKEKTDGSFVWDAYSSAYVKKYGQSPVRNAKQNALCSQLVTRLGKDSAILSAEFYVAHTDFFYTKKCHPLGLLVADAEKIDMERRKGLIMTKGIAESEDLRGHNKQILDQVLADRARKRAEGKL